MYRHPHNPAGHDGRSHIAVAACAVDLDGRVPTEIRLTPAGRFRARDGRPADVEAGWYIDSAAADRVIARARLAGDDPVIDYDHQTLYTRENGQPAPAAGWWAPEDMEWREDGLYATNVRWTDRAREAIAAGEYRYISPVLAYDKATGEVLAVVMAALVNYAAVTGLEDLAALAADRFSASDPTKAHEEDSPVKREQLIKLLGLANDATDEQIEGALTALKANAAVAGEVRTALGIGEGAPVGEAVTALKAKADTAKPDLSGYVPKAVFEETQAQLAALKAGSETAEVDRLIKEGLDDGRIAGQATADWLREQGLTALKAHLEDAPSIAALKGGTQTDGKPPEGADNPDGDELNAAQIAVCKSLRISQEDYKASLKEVY